MQIIVTWSSVVLPVSLGSYTSQESLQMYFSLDLISLEIKQNCRQVYQNMLNTLIFKIDQVIKF